MGHDDMAIYTPFSSPTATVVEVPPDADGRVDQAALKSLLDQHAGASRKIGSFNAASNVTGILEDIDGITALLHEHNAFAFWDYAAAGPHVQSAFVVWTS